MRRRVTSPALRSMSHRGFEAAVTRRVWVSSGSASRRDAGARRRLRGYDRTLEVAPGKEPLDHRCDGGADVTGAELSDCGVQKESGIEGGRGDGHRNRDSLDGFVVGEWAARAAAAFDAVSRRSPAQK